MWKSSYTVKVRRVVLSRLLCIEYHKRFLYRGSVEKFLHRGSKVPLSWLLCIEYYKRVLRCGNVEKFLHHGSEEGCIVHVRVHRIPSKIPKPWKRGDVPTPRKCGKVSYFMDVRVVLIMLGCIEYHKRSLRCGSMEKFLHHGSEEGCTEWNEFGGYPKVKVLKETLWGLLKVECVLMRETGLKTTWR